MRRTRLAPTAQLPQSAWSVSRRWSQSASSPAVAGAVLWPPARRTLRAGPAVDGDTPQDWRHTHPAPRSRCSRARPDLYRCRTAPQWPCGREARIVPRQAQRADGRHRCAAAMAATAIGACWPAAHATGRDVGERHRPRRLGGCRTRVWLWHSPKRASTRRGIWAGPFDDPADWRRHHGTETFDLWAGCWAWLDVELALQRMSQLTRATLLR